MSSSFPRTYPKKRILLSVCRGRISSDSLCDVLTFAAGLGGGTAEHYIDVVFMGDGVTECMSCSLTDEVRPYMTFARSCGTSFWADKDSLAMRGMPEDDLFEGCSIISTEEVYELLRNSDLHLRI